MEEYAGSVVYLDKHERGYSLCAKLFLYKAEDLKDSQKMLADRISELGVPGALVLDKKIVKIVVKDRKGYMGAFAVLKFGSVKADLVFLFAENVEQFAAVIASGYERSIESTTVLIETLDAKQLSDC